MRILDESTIILILTYLPKIDYDSNLEEEIAKINNKFKDLNNEIYIEYSVILNHIQQMNSDEREYLYFISKSIKRHLKYNQNNYSTTMLYKVIEYILLEIPRVNQFNQLNNQLNQSKELIRLSQNRNLSFDKKIKEFDRKISKSEEKIEKSQSEFISILSIFSAVVIAFFGGINLLGNTLTSVNNTNKYKLTMTLIILGMIMFNIIYMLLYVISRLIDKSVCSKKCTDCKNNKDFKCYLNKYPILFYYNIISILILTSGCFIYFADKYNCIAHFTGLTKFNEQYRFIAYPISVLMLIILVLIILVCIYKFSECNFIKLGQDFKTTNKDTNLDKLSNSNQTNNEKNLISLENIRLEIVNSDDIKEND